MDINDTQNLMMFAAAGRRVRERAESLYVEMTDPCGQDAARVSYDCAALLCELDYMTKYAESIRALRAKMHEAAYGFPPPE